jgi:hypothetical protein
MMKSLMMLWSAGFGCRNEGISRTERPGSTIGMIRFGQLSGLER